ncbi:ABC transporter permease [Conexibacter sp. JD483]|uniref:ABC transporter permease n=1 Tax=unclassified Conexibacter TaxID=2627773 RepID=UPI002721F54C|nr:MULTISPECIES: ABC transporter permease [unclassified Conexibacter]MDO8188474.1 ABC transporter permease [Conexibacter sp. CPCC 205706]MDO8201450.1 ABC transporter permease [Conexibacter sp. CPCC 205762]MDR9371756.1 ABC transporter permease [Conexibacter sp. JD483]
MRAELRAGLGFGRAPFLIMGGLLAVFLLLPLLVIVPTSWTSGMLIEFPPRGFSLQWYDRMLADPTWIDPLKVSLKIASIAALLATFFGTAAALGMRRLVGDRSSALIRSLFILPMAIPYVSYALGAYNLFLDLPAGLSETIVPLVLAQSLITFPLVYIVVSGALSGVDPRLASAASTLGARWPTVVWRIELPLVRPAIFAGALFAFATCFDEAVLAIFLSPIDQVTLAQQLYRSANEAIAPTLSAVSTSITLLAILVLGVATLIGRRAATRNGGTA